MRLTSALYRYLGGYCRRKRLRDVVRRFGECHSVIDLGGRLQMWQGLKFPAQITLINLEAPPSPLPSSFTYLRGDARDTAFPDSSFDLAFSNSVIEHVGGFEDQQRFANEMLRLGRHVYCQTPSKWFPIEPHFLTPFVHWLPRKWFTYTLHRYCTMQGLTWKPDRKTSRELIQGIRLLTRRELAKLFPGCRIGTEWFIGLPKSYIVWR